MQPPRPGNRAPLLWLVVPLIIGITAGRLGAGGHPALVLGGALIAAVAAAVAGWRDSGGWAPAVTVAFALVGMADYTLQRRIIPEWQDRPPREAELVLRVERVFASRNRKKTGGLARVVRADHPFRALTGQRVYFSGAARPGGPVPRRRATIVVVGVLTPLPEDPPADSFDGYLESSGVNFRLNRGRILREESPPPAYYQFCERAAARFRTILGLGIEDRRPALAGLLRAMMLGETRELTEDQHTIFLQSGTMHLFAISGLNIAVIAGAIQTVLLILRFPPWPRFLVGTPLLWLFVDITGAAPSAVRAFAMALFLQGAFVFRRPGNALASLTGSAAVVLLITPLQLFSASFLMSYAIVFALLALGVPLAESWLTAWTPWRDVPPVTWNRWQRWIVGGWRAGVTAVAIGLATMLVGMITSVQFFRLLTPGSLVANLVLIPSAVIVTLGGFVALVCGLAGFTAGAVLCNHASALVLLVIEQFVRQSVRVPWACVAAQFREPWVGSVALAALTAAFLHGYAAGWRPKRGGWWPPFVVVGLALALGVTYGVKT
ncbi:MAG TPA: ComEC/Rec2 family competence protein [Opitutaceae bacterium]|nr:ComEC/Rec2 family competence protein [Opitutaceae bacterium]